jgi:hypothetical protein
LNGINGQGYETFIGWVYVSFFVKVLVGTIGFHVKRHFSVENIPFKTSFFLNYKSPGWNHRISCETDFSVENISFEIRIFLIKVLVHPSATIHPFRTYPHFWTLMKMLPFTQHVRNMSYKCPKRGLAKILLKHEKHAICD